jgi:hypothetical protein
MSACPGEPDGRYCGGNSSTAVYNTGFGSGCICGFYKFQLIHPELLYRAITYEPVPSPSNPNTSAVRVLFILQLNGRASRQIRRLLKLIYRPQNYYLLHVDARQAFMQDGTGGQESAHKPTVQKCFDWKSSLSVSVYVMYM